MSNLSKKNFDKTVTDSVNTDTLLWGYEPASVAAALDQLKKEIQELSKFDETCAVVHLEGAPPSTIRAAVERLCETVSDLRNKVSTKPDPTKWVGIPNSIEEAINRLASEVATLKGSSIS